jgi:acetyl esterase/lipase
VLPGGGYWRQAPHEAEPVAEWLSSLGLHAFVLRYSVAPNRHPAPLIDAQAAMAWIRSGRHGLQVDASRVGVLGFSAGGHLAASLGTTDSPLTAPDLSVLCYPVISFTDQAHQGCVDNLLGPSPSDDDLKSVSVENHVTAQTPPAFLWHTFDDQAVSVEHSIRFAASLRSAGVPFELHIFPHGHHGLGLASGVPGASAWPSLCESWLEQQGWIRAMPHPRPAAVSAAI